MNVKSYKSHNGWRTIIFDHKNKIKHVGLSGMKNRKTAVAAAKEVFKKTYVGKKLRQWWLPGWLPKQIKK